MKILVIDDSATHIQAAKAQLSEHDLTVVDTYDAGRTLLQDKHDFDVVLTDLLMPSSAHQQGAGMKFVGQEMPIGIFLALLAAKNGARYVAVHTDSDHHSHPASACFDAFSRFFWGEPGSKHSGWSHHEHEPHSLRVEDAKLILSNNRNWVRNFRPDNLSTAVPWEEAQESDVHAKHWSAVLEHLLKD